VWRSSRGFFVSVDGYAFGPMTADQLIRFPRWLFRHLFEVKDHELVVALAVSRRLNDLKRSEWKRLLSRCEHWYTRWKPPKDLLEMAASTRCAGPSLLTHPSTCRSMREAIATSVE
jgi:hypothetical protein